MKKKLLFLNAKRLRVIEIIVDFYAKIRVIFLPVLRDSQVPMLNQNPTRPKGETLIKLLSTHSSFSVEVSIKGYSFP